MVSEPNRQELPITIDRRDHAFGDKVTVALEIRRDRDRITHHQWLALIDTLVGPGSVRLSSQGLAVTCMNDADEAVPCIERRGSTNHEGVTLTYTFLADAAASLSIRIDWPELGIENYRLPPE